MESHMKDKVTQLKEIANKIGMELKDQENLTNGLKDTFNKMSSIITNTTGKVGKACLYPLTPWDPLGPPLDRRRVDLAGLFCPVWSCLIVSGMPSIQHYQ